ncbi:MAG: type II toxin-antitoxin system VapC family toxin [Clostridiales Family XIII bacterium]|nr:type II toxin-antitoxin system VapC family toxin [Clostridiales Family XIII bacterium]
MRNRIYLDTSVISALFDERTPERMKQTKQTWENELPEYEVFISSTVLTELSNATTALKGLFLNAIDGFTVLEATDEAFSLADEYVNIGIFPEKYYDDALHVAIAATNGIPVLLSWNFTHLVKIKTRRMVALVNTEKNYLPVEIIAPPEL